MSSAVYYVICSVLVLGVLIGISMMSKVKTSVTGNILSAVCTLLAILVTFYRYGILPDWMLWAALAVGAVVGLYAAARVQMIQMPQAVAVLNGFGGAASALVAAVSLLEGQADLFSRVTAGLALAVGMLTLTGSLVAAAKLHGKMHSKPRVLPHHQGLITASLVVTLGAVAGIAANSGGAALGGFGILCFAASSLFGYWFAIRVGGADMPVAISLLNSFSGVAGSIAGMAISDPLLVAVGGVVGASGLLLTQVMCRAMNRSLSSVLLGVSAVPAKAAATVAEATEAVPTEKDAPAAAPGQSAVDCLKDAKRVIIVPGYGMAVAQAQSLVKQLADRLEADGKEVAFAIHPVAGRMPGHMNVLLAEVDIPYEKLLELDEVNPRFADCDVAVIIGANDVVNPAANTAESTPIYGMPILEVEKAAHIIICNYDLKPGYAGVENPLYTRDNASLLLGDARETLASLLAELSGTAPTAAPSYESEETSPEQTAMAWLDSARRVIIVPGYGMAVAQAQSLVKQLADRLEADGKEVAFAIHPVAGRMPGHMNVLLAEVDIPYEKLLELDEVNPRFADCDVAVIVGANDVVNPAANTAEGTPIYGMPILEVEKAAHIIICNYDLNPGYAGVENPLYQRENASLLLGDARETLASLCLPVHTNH